MTEAVPLITRIKRSQQDSGAAERWAHLAAQPNSPEMLVYMGYSPEQAQAVNDEWTAKENAYRAADLRKVFAVEVRRARFIGWNLMIRYDHNTWHKVDWSLTKRLAEALPEDGLWSLALTLKGLPKDTPRRGGY